MKKSCFGVLIAIFLLFGSFFGGKAFCRSATAVTGAKNGGAAISSRGKSTRTTVGSLPTALKSVLSQTLGANSAKYRLIRSGSGYRAVNGRNGLRAAIGLNGFTVRSGANEWGLKLTAWGRSRSLQKVAAGKVVSESNRVAINRGGLTEWWVNGPLGIEQRWTVAHRPHRGKDGGKLTLLLTQSGDLRAQAVSQGTSLIVSSNAGRQVLRYAGLTAYDKTGRRLPAYFEATRQAVRVVVDDANAVYPVRIDPWVQAAKLTASDGAAYDRFGVSVAVSSDGSIVVVGANYAKVGSNDEQGAVYVFKESASGWTNGIEVAKLTASDGAYHDQLGYEVAVSADGETVVAGAPVATVGNNRYGAVYVFKEPASGWADETQRAKLTVSDSTLDDGSGVDVAISSDGSTIVAGAPHARVGTNGFQGAAYVFKEPASGWANGTQTARLTASDGAASNYFGDSVSVSAGGKTVVVGADFATPVIMHGQQGAVYVFEEPASGWANETQTAELTASDGAANDFLGQSTALSPDGATVVAGAWHATVNGNVQQGAVYVFKEPASGWTDETQTAKLTASDGATDNQMGISVAVGSDGITVVAGADDAAVGGNNQQGAVYIFKEPASGWTDGTQTAKLAASDGALNDHLGFSVAVSPDGATVLAGAYFADVGGHVCQGAVYVFQGPLWANATPTGNGWYYLSPFGAFNTNSSPWIYHQTLGWLYPVGTSTDSLWFYDPQWDGNGGWWWSGSSFFPWVYSTTEGEWLYFDAGDSNPGARWFFTAGGQASTH